MKKMEIEKLFNCISLVVGFLGGILSHYLGGWDILLKTIVVLAMLDYLTGWIKGVFEKRLSSEIGFKGLLKKIMMFIVIATSHIIQELLGGQVAIREVVIMFYISNEALSIIENAAIFVPIPDRLRDVLLQLREKEDDAEEEE